MQTTSDLLGMCGDNLNTAQYQGADEVWHWLKEDQLYKVLANTKECGCRTESKVSQLLVGVKPTHPLTAHKLLLFSLHLLSVKGWGPNKQQGENRLTSSSAPTNTRPSSSKCEQSETLGRGQAYWGVPQHTHSFPQLGVGCNLRQLLLPAVHFNTSHSLTSILTRGVFKISIWGYIVAGFYIIRALIRRRKYRYFMCNK